jgi:hypothetical protein
MRLRNGIHKYKAYVQPVAEYIGLFRAVNEYIVISRGRSDLQNPPDYRLIAGNSFGNRAP